jgi:hypothetical protein
MSKQPFDRKTRNSIADARSALEQQKTIDKLRKVNESSTFLETSRTERVQPHAEVLLRPEVTAIANHTSRCVAEQNQEARAISFFFNRQAPSTDKSRRQDCGGGSIF